MSKTSELHALRHSFSGDTQVKAQSRSGDASGNGVERWNFIASVQSAEADIIDREERTEQAEARSLFARVLILYLKKILSPDELKFIEACIRSDKTPYKIGIALKINYAQFIQSINKKYQANEQELLLLMRVVGYDFRHGLVFLPKLQNYFRKQNYLKNYYKTNKAKRLAYVKEHYLENRPKVLDYHKRYYQKNRENILRKQAEYCSTRKTEIAERDKKYRETHKAEIQEKKREYNATPRARELAKARRARFAEQHPEKVAAYSATYKEKHRAEIREKNREWARKHRAEIREKKLQEQQAIEEAKA